MTMFYPRDLIAPFRAHIEGLSSENIYDKHRKCPLPDDKILLLLLDYAYHASFQTEEGRRPGFRIIFSSPSDLNLQTLRISSVPNRRIVHFEQPRPFTASEIIRIAPAAELQRFLICVQNCGTAQSPILEIWGLLDVGDNWSQFVRNEANSGSPPPNKLTITSTAPGEISLSSSGSTHLSLRNGALIRHSGNALWKGPIADHLETARNAFYKNVTRVLKKKLFDTEGHDNNYPQRSYTQFLERILHNIQIKSHGGTLLVIPDELSPSDTRLTDRLVVKYPCLYDHAWEALTNKLCGHRKYYDLHFGIIHGKTKLDQNSFTQHGLLDSELEEIDEALADIAQSTGALSSVDGAVLMTDKFRIFGFGAEVICTSPSLTSVRIAESKETVPISAFGTRHRAAFRFCSNFESAIAFVVSQDGGIKAIKRVGPDVILWPDINNHGL